MGLKSMKTHNQSRKLNGKKKEKSLLEIEVSTFSDGLAMQFIRYYHGDYAVTLEDIIACGKLWNRDMIERRA